MMNVGYGRLCVRPRLQQVKLLLDSLSRERFFGLLLSRKAFSHFARISSFL